jgi:hypothetical protein
MRTLKGDGIATDAVEGKFPLSGGRVLSVQLDATGSDRITVRSPSGQLELSVEIGPDGPRLRVEAVDIDLVASRRLSLQCSELDIAVSGDAKLAAEKTMTLVGQDVHVGAPRGEITLHANDDVDVRGERVRLNCEDQPMPVDWDEFRLRQGERGGS